MHADAIYDKAWCVSFREASVRLRHAFSIPNGPARTIVACRLQAKGFRLWWISAGQEVILRHQMELAVVNEKHS